MTRVDYNSSSACFAQENSGVRISAQSESPNRSKIARDLPPNDPTMATIGLVVSLGIKMKPRGFLW